MSGGLIFGREPATLAAAFKAAVALFAAFFLPLSIEQQGGINALFAAVLGVVVAMAVSAEKALPLLLGLVEAAVYLGVAFGWQVPADSQALIVAFTGAVVAIWTRDRVTAPIGPDGAWQ